MPVKVQENAEIQQHKVYHIEKIQPKKAPLYFFIKRALDIFVSLLGLIICFAPMIIIMICIYVDCGGPAFFRQERLGKDGKAFLMFKFRSMRVDAEEDGPQWAAREDSRVTRIGRFLRKTRLDELPQLFNILKGDMSFVGPRPEREYFYDQFETYIHGFSNRLVVRPGLTGWAQINGGYDLSAEEKIVYDMEYIKNMSLGMDFKCVYKTIKLVFTHEGAH